MKSTTVALYACALMLTTTACKQTVNSVQRADPQSQPDYINDSRISTDFTLSRKARVISLNEKRLDNDRLKVQVQIQNLENDEHTINYRFEWIDQDGMVSRQLTSNWKSITLSGRELRSVSATASDADVVDFRLELIEPRPAAR